MTKLHKELISRGAMLLLGVPIVFGGVKSCQAGHQISKEAYEARRNDPYRHRRDPGGGLPNAIGAVMILFGGVLSIAALAGDKTREWLLQPTEPPGYE